MGCVFMKRRRIKVGQSIVVQYIIEFVVIITDIRIVCLRHTARFHLLSTLIGLLDEQLQ